MNQMTAKLEPMPTDALVDLCCKLARDFRPEAGIVSDAALAILERRLPCDKFVAFCDELYAAMG